MIFSPASWDQLLPPQETDFKCTVVIQGLFLGEFVV